MKERKNFYCVILLTVLLSALCSKCLYKEPLTPAKISDIQSSFAPTEENKKSVEPVLKDGINKASLNQDVLKNHNDAFSNEITTGKIGNQGESGRCWLFASLNFFRPAAMKKLNTDDFEFSVTYLYFWDKMEKANFALEKEIKGKRKTYKHYGNFLDDGGNWLMFAALVEKYGAVPLSAMPETKDSQNSDQMLKNLNQRLLLGILEIQDKKSKGASLKKLRQLKTEIMKNIYKMLVFHLGFPPETFYFTYTAKTGEIYAKGYTPKTFAQEFVPLDDDNEFVSLVNLPEQQKMRLYSLKYAGVKFITAVEEEDMKGAVLNSVLHNEPAFIGVFMSQNFDKKSGIMHSNLYQYEKIYGIKIADYEVTEEFLSNNGAHKMIIVGADVKDGKVVKWKVQNSWGEDVGKSGYFFMYDSWFNNYVHEVVVKREYLPEHLQKYLKKHKPIYVDDAYLYE